MRKNIKKVTRIKNVRKGFVSGIFGHLGNIKNYLNPKRYLKFLNN